MDQPFVNSYLSWLGCKVQIEHECHFMQRAGLALVMINLGKKLNQFKPKYI